jgi:hypothetical protein
MDYGKGKVQGTMTALNVPGTKNAIVTCWEGEVVNDRSACTRGGGQGRAVMV